MPDSNISPPKPSGYSIPAFLLGAVLSALLAYSTPTNAAERKPNFLVIVSDDQRPDTIRALGNKHIHTPHLDRLVREGMTFTRATCAFPLCVPSRAEILTGATGWKNGVPFAGGKLRKEMNFWADTMRDAGYYTWYSGKWMNDGSPKTRGYDATSGLFSSGGGGKEGAKPRYGRKGRLITGYRGWTFKTNDGRVETHKGIGLVGETSQYIADGAIDLLLRKPTKPFFLHVNFTAPHDPLVIPPDYEGKYDPTKIPLPKNFLPEHPFDHGNFNGRDEKLLPWPRTEAEVREEIAAYYAVIDDMDAHIGRILKTLDRIGQRDNTVIIFSSDHGLAVGSHGLMGKQNMYEHSIGVPFIIAGPGIPKDRRTRAQIYLRDMYPTTCELAGIPIPKTVEAKSFVPVLRGEKKQIHPEIYGYFYNYQRMVRTDRWKLIHYPHLKRYQLFDLKNDPDEVNDLSKKSDQQKRVKNLNRKLTAWFEARESSIPK
jgi:arylsulfatase A-like enzyme